MLYKYYFYVGIFLCLSACNAGVNTYQFSKIESLVHYENQFTRSIYRSHLQDIMELHERDRALQVLIDSHYLHFLDSFELLNRNFVAQIEGHKEALNFTNPQTFATQNSVAEFVNMHKQNSQAMLKKLYHYNKNILALIDTTLQTYYKKRIQNLIDSAYILTETPLFNLQKLNYEEMRLCFLLLQSETKRIENQTVLICYQLCNAHTNLAFEELVFVPNFRYQKIRLGDTCEIAFNIYHPYKFGTNDYLVFQKDTIRNLTNQTLYNFPTHKVGKQQIFVRFYKEHRNSYWSESSGHIISYEVVK